MTANDVVLSANAIARHNRRRYEHGHIRWLVAGSVRRHIPLALATIFTVAMSVLALQAQCRVSRRRSLAESVAIADGDTITVLLAKQQHPIRLEGIDALGSAQELGTKAKQVLSGKIFGKDVTANGKAAISTSVQSDLKFYCCRRRQ